MGNKWIGTPVPVDGVTTVEKIYLNTNLSIEEVLALFEQVEYQPAGLNDEYENYTVFSGGLANLTISNQFSLNGCIMIQNGFDSGVIEELLPFLYTEDPNTLGALAQQGVSIGWNPKFKGYIEVNRVSEVYEATGKQNDLLSSLFSITPFVKAKPATVQEAFEDIADAIREKNGEEGTMKSYDMPDKIRALPNGATVTVPGGWGGTPVPIGVMVEKVYLNTAMSIEEVNTIISNPDIPYDSKMPVCVVLADETKEHSLIIGAKNGATMIADFSNNKYYFAYGADAANEFGFEGWDPDFNGVIEVNYVNALPGEGVGGGMNDKLSSLFSITPFVKATGEEILLEGEYDGSTVDIDVQAAGGSEPTPVPNSGYVENVYFNTNLSTEEVVSILDNAGLTFPDHGEAECVIASNDGLRMVAIMNLGENGYMIMYCENGSSGDIVLVFSSASPGITQSITGAAFSGWNLAFGGVFEFNATAADTMMNEQDVNCLTTKQNELSQLFSITPFTGGSSEPCIDLKQYIENKQIPLKINLTNIPSGIDTTDADATAEDILNGKTAYVNGEKVTGTHECVSAPGATITTPGEGSLSGTPILATGTSDGIYFNISQITEKVNTFIKKAGLTFVNDSYTVCKFKVEGDSATHDITIAVDGTDMYQIKNTYTTDVYFYGRKVSGNYGWNRRLLNGVDKPVTFIECGSENDKLSFLISSTPLDYGNGESIVVEGEYDGSVVSIDVQNAGTAATPVPNSGYVEKVYFNTSLSYEEVKEILSVITCLSDYNCYYVLINSDNSKFVRFADTNYTLGYTPSGYWITAKDSNGVTHEIFNSARKNATYGNNYTGWHPDFNGVIEFNDTATAFYSFVNAKTVGIQNYLISKLLSTTPFDGSSGDKCVDLKPYIENKQIPLKFNLNNIPSESLITTEDEVITLEGEYDGSTVDIDVQAAGSDSGASGTAVPNEGHVENIYFNTSLSVEEVTEIVNSLELIDAGQVQLYNIASDASKDNNKAVGITVMSGGVTVINAGIMPVFASQDLGTGFVGWNPDFANPFIFNGDVVAEYDAGSSGTQQSGHQNDKLSSLISITPFTGGSSEPCIDLKQYIDNKQIPLKINLTNIPSGGSGGPVSGLGTDYGVYLCLGNGQFEASNVTMDISNAKIINPDNIPIYYQEGTMNMETQEVTTGDIKLFEGDLNSLSFTFVSGSTEETVEGSKHYWGDNMNNSFTIDQNTMTVTSNQYFIKLEDAIDKTLPHLQISVRPRDGESKGSIYGYRTYQIVKTEGTEMYGVKSSRGNDSYKEVTSDTLLEILFVFDYVFVVR